ncbi:unnamed protein product [Phaedon cochleariae]|uniref:Uncharacterized protein n=1 Tax=Phaedon cochleariae TaxID=80249 RepID=A0A9P0GPZ5_PHACE|nr:unnamed protein product [Phaedon cochleariae]
MEKTMNFKQEILTILLVRICFVSSQDITQLREYGCQWHGGSSATLACYCQNGAEMIVRSQSIPAFDTTTIEINGCKLVKFEDNSISDMRNLRSITLNNIESLIFDSRSMNWYGYKENHGHIEERFDMSVPSLKISITQSNVSLISSHTFTGRINEITFDTTTIDKISPLAFANLLQSETIAIRNSVIKDIEVQSFKKFSTEYLELNGVSANFIPSRTFSNITVYQNFTIDNCNFNTVRSSGFTIYNPQVFQVTNTNISHLNGEAFSIVSRGIVIFRNNVFGEVNDGAFQGITLQRDTQVNDISFIFESNSLSKLTRYSLGTTDFKVQYRNIYIGEQCDCTDIDHKIIETSYYSEIMCLHDEEYMTVRDFKSNMCSIVTNYYITLIIVCVVIILVIVVVSILVMYYKFVYRKNKYGGPKQGKNGQLSLIVPDGRTYRETELHVIVEKTDLLTTDL